jgi:quinol monooxygenase YgiN
MGRYVIAAYTPKPGMADQLLTVVLKRLPLLRAHDLATDRPAYRMRAKDGTILEVSEWQSAEAIERAHSTPAVLALWAEFGEVCEYRSLNSIAECGQMFAEFEPLD